MALPNKTKIPVGTVLAGKYRITREIGRGGMAAVYEAANVDIGKRVAIKVLAQELTTSAVVVERFLREARAAAAIRSPYICDIYDSGRLDDGRPFLVLELLEGDSLYERMTKIRWLDVDTTIMIVTQVCRGLTKAHAANIVHRDLKPENIFLTKDEDAQLLSKILDFGLAKFYAPVEGDGPQARLTREGAVFGTPAYMSPEQVRGQGAVDHRADLWALGCIVYECFTGRTVWSTEQGVAMTFAQIANAQLPRPATYRPDLPPDFTAWFDRALNRDISQRFQSARELAGEFAAVFNRERAEISLIQPSPALSLPKGMIDGFDNPFLLGGPASADSARSREAETQGLPIPSAPGSAPRRSAPLSAPVGHVSVREMPPASTSSPRSGGPSSGSTPGLAPELVSDAGRTSGAGGEPAPASPRPSKLGFAANGARVGTRSRTASAASIAAVAGAAVLLGGVAFLAWKQLADKTPHPAPASSASATVAGPSSGSATTPDATGPSAATSATRPPPLDVPTLAWTSLVRDGQQALSSGDAKQANKLFKDAFDKGGGHGVPRTLLEHLGMALSSGDKAACKLTGLARPRTYDLVPGGRAVGAGRPSIAVGPHGAIMTWTDAHEGNEHAYAVALDDALRNVGAPLDVTPEGTGVQRPTLARAGDRFVVVYADGKGPEAGVHGRLLDADGHIAGASVQIATPRSGWIWPSVAGRPDGSFFVGWTEEADADSEDLFVRRLSPTLELTGDPIRATDLVAAGPTKARARFPSLAVAGDSLLATFRLERDPLRLIEHLRVPLADADKGLAAAKKGDARTDRHIGDMALVNTDKSKADGPSLACGSGACFLGWQTEQNGGAWVAYIDPAAAQPLVRRHFSKQGAHPAVGVADTGQAQVVWFEAGRVLTASISKDGVGTPARVARISGDQPMPSIVAGTKPGEWYVAWLDYETGHLEPYAARVLCR